MSACPTARGVSGSASAALSVCLPESLPRLPVWGPQLCSETPAGLATRLLPGPWLSHASQDPVSRLRQDRWPFDGLEIVWGDLVFVTLGPPVCERRVALRVSADFDAADALKP